MLLYGHMFHSLWRRRPHSTTHSKLTVWEKARYLTISWTCRSSTRFSTKRGKPITLVCIYRLSYLVAFRKKFEHEKCGYCNQSGRLCGTFRTKFEGEKCRFSNQSGRLCGSVASLSILIVGVNDPSRHRRVVRHCLH